LDSIVKKVFRCDCFVHGFGIDEWFEEPKIKRGVDVETEEMFDGEFVDISIDFWYYGYGSTFYDTFKQRVKAAWLLLNGRRATFDAFSFRPAQIREIGEHLIAEADRLKELGYREDGVKE
jgi:hypothetical protein